MDRDVLVVGESLVDIVNAADGEVREYAGGSAANVAVALARLGRPVRFATSFAEDDHGRLIAEHLDSAGVTKIQSGTIIGYLQADLFVEMLKKASPDYSKLVEKMNGGVKITPADGGIPTEWPKFHTEGAPCTSVVKVESKTYKLAAPYACYEAFK